MNAPSLADAALALAKRTVPVFPLMPRAKTPATEHGFHDATCDVEQVRAWWAENPRFNIGAATGHRFWAIDIDGPEGAAQLAELECVNGKLPLTIEQRTPRGRHLLFVPPSDGVVIRCSASRVAPHVDVRALGGFLCMAPSIHPSGARYAWVRNGARGFATPPPWLIERALPPAPPPRNSVEPVRPPADLARYVARAIASELADLEQAPEGQRNDRLNKTAFCIGRFVGSGAVPTEWAAIELERRGIALGLRPAEVRATVASGLAAGSAQPRELPR